MNEKKKTIIILSILIGIILLIPIAYYFNYTKGKNMVTAVDDIFADEETNLVFIGRPTCSYCAMLKPVLDDFTEKYNFTYHYVNTDELNANQLQQILDKFDKDIKTFGTPYLAFVADGKITDEQSGYVNDERLFDFLQKNEFIDAEEVFEPKETNLAVIDYEDYTNLLSSGNEEIIIIAQSGCSACESAKPVLDEIAEEYDLAINWLDIIKLSTNERNSFDSSLDYLQTEEWGTPLALIVKDNKVIDSEVGFISKEKYIDFLEENDFIK